MTYFATYTGRKIDLETISEDDICLEDIAHHLTQVQRFGGALPFGKVYSVAEHSLRMADYLLYPDMMRLALLHDASEAYMGDLITGLKRLVPEYKELENKVQSLIYKKYRVVGSDFDHFVIKDIDTRIVLDEVLGLMPEKYELYQAQLITVKPLGIEIDGLQKPEYIERLFLDTCTCLGVSDYDIVTNSKRS